MSAYNFTYEKSTWLQELEDWMMIHVRCVDYLVVVSKLVIHHNLKSTINKACHYESDLNPTYQQLIKHYQTTVIPYRSYKPQDESKTEVGAQIIERLIISTFAMTLFYLKAAQSTHK